MNLMKIANPLLKYLFVLVCMGCTSLGFSQGQWEVDMVRNINPTNPDNPIWKGFSSTAQPIAVAVPLGILAVSLIKENKKGKFNAFEVTASLAIASIATESIKLIVNRPRPYETYTDIYPNEIDNGNSYPSGHTSIVFTTATSLTLISKKWYIAVPAFAWATGVGYSRIYLGQHYPSDVIMGTLVGAGSAFASHWLRKKIFEKKKK